jgi:hypothetical protein
MTDSTQIKEKNHMSIFSFIKKKYYTWNTDASCRYPDISNLALFLFFSETLQIKKPSGHELSPPNFFN